MIFLNEIAQRLDNYDNESLVDFFPVHLPCQVLVVDTVGVERRSTPAITQFILRAVSLGLGSVDDVAGMLGIETDHCQSLMRDLELAEYIGADPFGSYSIWRRGKEVLAAEGENAPIDRRLQIVWDPVCGKFLGPVPMYTRRRAGNDGVFVPLAGAFAVPALALVGPAALKEIQHSAAGSRGGRATTYDVLRVTTIHKSIARYREAVALIYKGDKGDYSLRMATNGNIDEKLTASCAQAGVAKLIGVDKSFSSRHGGLAVRKRYGEIGKGSNVKAPGEALVRRRSVLRFKVSMLNSRILENEREDLISKRDEAAAELEAVNVQVKDIPVVPIRCHEIRSYLLDALDSAKRRVCITTTMPMAERFDFEMADALRDCLARGITVELYIAGRPSADDGILAKLDKLSQSSDLKVNFLAEPRTVFEIARDSQTVVFSNASPLGARLGPILPRESIGYYISEPTLTERYMQNHLRFEKGDFVLRIRPPNRDAGPKTPNRLKVATGPKRLKV